MTSLTSEALDKIKDEFVAAAASLFTRGYATGAAGNMSQVLPDGTVLATPTGSSMGKLDKERLSIVTMDGELICGDKPTKEVAFHLAIYKANPSLKAVVHLHSCYCTALSCLNDLDKENVIKPFTPYVVMRMGDVPLVPYYKPGSAEIAQDLSILAPNHKAFLLANHGPITCGANLTEAVNNAEELEATAKLYFVLNQDRNRIAYLSQEQVAALKVSKA